MSIRKTLSIVVCSFIAVVTILSCQENRVQSNLEQTLDGIIGKYGKWEDNDLATESFKKELVSLFNDSKGKNFQTFYNGELKFDDIVDTPEGHTNNTDTVVVRFNGSITCLTPNDNDAWILFKVLGKLTKDEAIKLNRETGYKIDGNILGFIEDVNIDRIIARIDMGMIMMDEIHIIPSQQ